MPKYVLWGDYCDDVVEKRAPYRQAHLDGLAEQKAAGILITLGPTQDLQHVFGIYEADEVTVVRNLIESDPYWKHGIWTSYRLHEWIQAV
ncbi:MAG: YciI family protein [Thermosynechococcaceae cyanobacterium]